VLAFRLVLRQPSPIWCTFHVEELNVYHDLPRRVPRPLQHSHPITDLVHCQVLIQTVCHVIVLVWISRLQLLHPLKFKFSLTKVVTCIQTCNQLCSGAKQSLGQ
jgi:hypothetical protein